MSIWKRSISLMLVLLMCFSFMSSSFIMAFADDEADVTEETEVVQVEDEVDVPEEVDVRSPEVDVVDESEVVDASEDAEDSTDVVEPSEEPIESEEATTEVPEETEIQSTEETEVVEESEVPEETKISEETEAPEETNTPELEGPVDASEKLIGIKYSGVWGTTSIIEADGTSHDFFTSFDAVADYAPDENDFVGYIKPIAGSKVKVVSYYDAGNWDIKVYSVKGEDVTSIQSHQSMGETRAEITLTGDEDYIAVTFSPKPIQASTRAISAGSSISLAAIHFKNTGNFDASGDVGAGNEPKDGIDIIYAKGSSSGHGTPVYCLDGMAQHYEGAPMDYFGAIIEDKKVERAGYGLCNPILDYAYNMHGASTSQYGNFSRLQIFKMLDHILVHGYKGTEINMNNMPLNDKMSFAETQVALWAIQMYIVYGRIPYRGWNGVNAPGHIEKYFKVPSAEYDACKALVANARSSYSSLTNEQLNNCLVWTKEVKMPSGNTTRFVQPIAYYKQQVNKGFSLKKSVVNNASLQACVKDNPLYSLAGAQYGIYTNANATGTPVETLTTDANGNATGTKTFAVGTTIYAKEIKAPTGYLLDTTIYSIEIKSDESQNVFKVQDTPALDPMSTEIKKVDKDNNSYYLQGAVFKLTYYSAHWANDNAAVKRVWYLKTDANGIFKYKDSYLASGYNSDPLFKNQHGVPQLPLGIVQVKEEKAPEGFKLLDKVIYYNITQGSNGHPEGEWVTPSLKPISQDSNYTPWFQYSASDDTLKIYNKENSKPVTVKKVTDIDNNLAYLVEGNNAYTLKDAEFKFSAEGYETKTVKTNANGEASSPLEYVVGTVVTIEEVSAPAGHTIPSTNTEKIKTITVKENQDNIVTFADPPIFGKAPTIKKLDAVNGEPLGLAEFEIKYYPGTSTTAKYTWTAISDTTGLVDFNFSKFPNGKIPFGCFEVKEIKAPENYLKTDVVGYFRVSQDDPQGHWVKSLENDNPVDKYNAYVEINPDGPSQLMWKNNKQSKPVSLKKAYSATSAQLALIENNSSYSLSGARYEIWVSDSKEGVYTLSETVKTNAHGEATSAEEYYIGYWVKVREVEAPAGCVLNNEFTAPKEIVNGENLFDVKDEPIFGKAPDFKKVDVTFAESPVMLADAEFEVSYYPGSSTTAKYTWTLKSDENGCVALDNAHLVDGDALMDVIPFGAFSIKETKAPEHFELADVTAYYRTEQSGEGSSENWVKSLTDSTSVDNYNSYVVIKDGALEWGNVRPYGGASLIKYNVLYGVATVSKHNFDGIKFEIKSNNDFEEKLLKGVDKTFKKNETIMTVEVHWFVDGERNGYWRAATVGYNDGAWLDESTGFMLMPGDYYFQEVTLNDYGKANGYYFADPEPKYFTVEARKITKADADGNSLVAKDSPVRGNLEFQKLSQSHYPVEGVPYLLTNNTTGEQHIIVTGVEGWFRSADANNASPVNQFDSLMGKGWLKDEETGLYTINTPETRISLEDLYDVTENEDGTKKYTAKVSSLWFYKDESGTESIVVDLEKFGALTPGNYSLQELYADTNFGLDSNLNHVDGIEIGYDALNNGEPALVSLETPLIDDEHLEIKTNAWNAELALGHHMVIVGKGENKIIDTVSVNADGIVPGYKYRLNAQLHTYYFDQASLDGIVGTTEFSYDTIEDILEADAADGVADGIIHIDVVLSIPDDFYDLVMEEGIAHIDLEGRYTYIAESLEVLARNKESDEQYWEQRAEHNDKNDTNQWILFPKIRTRAWDKDTQDHVSRETLGGNDTVTWVDELKYEAIWEGYNVKVHTWLVDSETGEPLVIDGEPVDTWREFTSQWYTGSFQVDVTLKTEGLVGKTYTFMEEVYAVIEDGEGGTKEVLIGEHKDKDDVEQQIQIPEGRTTAWGVEQGVHMVQESTSMEVNDLFFYHNLIEGKEYELDVALALKSGELIGLKNATVYFDGKKIEGTTGKFTATGRDGVVHIMVVFDGTDLAGSPIVFLERVRYNDVDIILHADLNDEEQTVNVIDIHTLAHFDEGLKYVQAGSKVKWYDEVSYTGLEVGKEYALDTKIAFKDAKVIEGNAEIKYLETGEMRLVFTPEKPDGKVIIETEIDTAKLGGKAFVFFEYLSVLETSEDEEGNEVIKETEVAKHEDLKDEGQTVRVLDMRTKAVSEKNGTKILEVGKTVQLRDTVSNFGFPIDEEFTWVGYVYDVATGKPIEQNGEPIKLEWTGKLSDPNQEIIMKFTLDTTVLEGKKLSIMEEVYNKDGKLILEHNKDLKDDDQTVTVDTSVRTGDGTTPMSVGIGLVTAGIMLATMLTVMYVRKRKVSSAE